MTDHNENRAAIARVLIDKGIVHVERSNMRPMPAGILSMTPLNGAAAPQRVTDTRAGYELGPVTPSPPLQQTPTDAPISANVRAGLSRQAPGIEQRVNEFLRRK
jgi:hypothetical protein